MLNLLAIPVFGITRVDKQVKSINVYRLHYGKPFLNVKNSLLQIGLAVKNYTFRMFSYNIRFSFYMTVEKLKQQP